MSRKISTFTLTRKKDPSKDLLAKAFHFKVPGNDFYLNTIIF